MPDHSQQHLSVSTGMDTPHSQAWGKKPGGTKAVADNSMS